MNRFVWLLLIALPTLAPAQLLYDYLSRDVGGEILRKNQRMSVIYGNLARMDEKRRTEIQCDASTFLESLKPWLNDKP